MYELNDDMDELFRRAAKDYPLDTNSADWNKLQEAMQKAAAIDMPGSKKKGKRRLLWLLLLLLPLAWAGYKYSGNGTKSTRAENTGKTVAAANSMTNNGNTAKQPISKDNGDEQVTKDTQPEQPSRPVPMGYLTNGYSRLNNRKIQDRSLAPEMTDYSNGHAEKGNKEKQIQLIKKDNDPPQTLTPEAPSLLSEPIALLVDKTGEKKNDTAGTKAPVEKKNTSPAQKQARKNSRTKGLYLGIAGGPDLSNVKFQKIKNIGLNGGIIIGYQLSKRFSVESGAAWNKKYYYSEGQYLSTKNIYVPPNTKIENVKGDCNMIEWPLNLRYTIKNNGTATWSGVAGVSSYFMMRENYAYLYLYPNGQIDTRNRAYKNTSNDWLSVINLGFTYSHQLGRSGSLRIEPYIKLPVKGLGIGSLPIMSTGVNAGFIKKIF